MQRIEAARALLASGWVRDLVVDIGDDGRIASVGAATASGARDSGSSTTSDARRAPTVRVDILLPAIANLHSHAFQRAMAGLAETGAVGANDSFWSWRRLMYRFVERLTPEDVTVVARLAYMEMLEAGYASVGEFHYLHHARDGAPYTDLAELATRIVAAAHDTGIGLTLLPVLYAQADIRGRALDGAQRRFGNDFDRYARLWQAAARAMDAGDADARIGVAPHSLRAVSAGDLSRLTTLVAGPVHIHAAEQTAEVDAVVAATGLRPVEWLLERQGLDSHWCLIHATHMTPAETVGLARSGAVAGLCPITESNLGDGIFDGVRFLAADGRLGIGSDSHVRIALAEELRTLEYSQRLRDRARACLARAVPPERSAGVADTTDGGTTPAERSTGRALYDAAGRGGATALARDSGRIVAGALADLVALGGERFGGLASADDRLLDRWIFTGDDRSVTDVWSAGRHMVRDGRHIARDTVVRDYEVALRCLMAR